MTDARPPEDEDEIDEAAPRPSRPAIMARVVVLAVSLLCLAFGFGHWLIE